MNKLSVVIIAKNDEKFVDDAVNCAVPPMRWWWIVALLTKRAI